MDINARQLDALDFNYPDPGTGGGPSTGGSGQDNGGGGGGSYDSDES